MSGLDFSKLSDQQLTALHAAGGDLSKLSDDDLKGIHSSLNPSLGRRVLDAAKDVGGEVADFGKRAGEYRDTQLLKAMGGVAGMPRAAADAGNWAFDKLAELGVPKHLLQTMPVIGPAVQAGSMLPTGGEVSDSLLGIAKGDGSGFKERSINPVVDAGVQALISGPVMGVGGKYGPAMNAFGGMGSEAAGEVARHVAPDYETPARIAGAVLGGGGAAGVQAGLTKGIPAMVRPFTGAGQEAIAGQTLRKAAADPESAIRNIESYQTGREAYPDAVGPGFAVDAGKASRDPGLMAAAEVAAAKNPGMRAQFNTNNQVLTDAMDRAAAGLPPAANAGPIIQDELGKTVEGLKGVRAMETGPLYDAARKSPTPVKPFPLMTYTADAVAANKGEPASVMQKARDLLFTTDKNGRTIPDRSSRGMMAMRDALGDMLGNQELGGYSRSLLQEMKGKVDEALNAVPQAKAANTRYAELSKNLDPFNPDLGDLNATMGKVVERDQFGKGYTTPAEKVPGMVMKGGDLSGPMVQHMMMASGGNPAVKQAMQAAYIADFRKAAGSMVAEDAAGNARLTANGASKWLKAHEGGAANVLTPEQLGALRDIERHLTDQAQTVPGRTGSPTFDRIATESIVGALVNKQLSNAPFLYPVKRALGLAMGGADEAIATKVYEALADPAMAKALMKKATPGNVKMAEPILARLTASALSQSGGRE